MAQEIYEAPTAVETPTIPRYLGMEAVQLYRDLLISKTLHPLIPYQPILALADAMVTHGRDHDHSLPVEQFFPPETVTFAGPPALIWSIRAKVTDSDGVQFEASME